MRPTTLREARLMALGSATTSTLTNLAAATAWQPFRTIEASHPKAVGPTTIHGSSACALRRSASS